MKSVNWWQWLCIGLLAVACSLMTAGCSGDDGEDGEDGAAAPTPAPSGGNDQDDSADDPAPQVKSEVLWDGNIALSYGDTQDYVAELPADGTVSITASWTAIDLIAGGAPIDCPIQFRVNHAMLSDHNSPYGWSGHMAKGEFCEMVVKNNATDTRATIHVRAVFTPD